MAKNVDLVGFICVVQTCSNHFNFLAKISVNCCLALFVHLFKSNGHLGARTIVCLSVKQTLEYLLITALNSKIVEQRTAALPVHLGLSSVGQQVRKEQPNTVF